MLFFGHVGFGELIARPFSKDVPVKAVLLGTILPDLVDKSLYYIPSLLTGRHGAELGFISGTRSVGHCFLFLIIYALFAFRSRRPFLVGLALGMFTHIPLDVVADYFRDRDIVSYPEADPIYAYFFPFLGFHFPVIPYESMGQHAAKLLDKTIVGTELLGIALLFFKFRKRILVLFTGLVFLGLIGCGPGLDTTKNSYGTCSNGFRTSFEVATGTFQITAPTGIFRAQTFEIVESVRLSKIVLPYKKTASGTSFDLDVLAGATPSTGGSPLFTASFSSNDGAVGTMMTAVVEGPAVTLSSGNYFIRLANFAGFQWYLNDLSTNYPSGSAYCESSGTFFLLSNGACGPLSGSDHAFSLISACN